MAQIDLPIQDFDKVRRIVDGWTLTPSGRLRQAAVIGDPAVDAAVAAVKNTAVDPTAYGLVTRRSSVALPHHKVALAGINATVVKNSAGVVHLASVSNCAPYQIFVKFFDKASPPTPGSDTVKWTIRVQAGADRDVAPPPGVYFPAGVSYAIVKNAADTDNTPVAVGDCILDLFLE